MDIILLYLFTRVDSIKDALAIPGWIFFVAALGTMFISFLVMKGHEPTAGHKERYSDWKIQDMLDVQTNANSIYQFGKRFVKYAALAVAISLALPSKQDLAIIIGGHFAYEGVTSEAFKEGATETSSKLYQLIQQELDSALEATDSNDPTEESE